MSQVSAQSESIAALEKAFMPQEWLAQLSSQIGVSVNSIPEDVRKDILTKNSKAWVNRAFFEWFNNRPVPATGFNPEDLLLFKTMVGYQNSPEYIEALRRVNEYTSMAQRCFSDANSNLANIHTHRMKLLQIEGKGGIDLTSEIELITKDGWFKYNKEMTEGLNANLTNKNDICLAFTTPNVIARHLNADAGIDLSVDFGSFQIVYKPLKGRIIAYKFEDNTVLDGRYYHPHIDTEGNVCWGSADTTYVTSMRECKPYKAFLALRIILCSYNDQSPYRTMSEFHLKKHPDKLKNLPIVKERYEQDAWVRGDLLQSDAPTIEESTDDDGEEIYLVRAYIQVYQGTQIRPEGTTSTYYYKRATGAFHEISEDDIQDWS